MKNGNGVFARSFIARALGSSVFAHIIDSAVFETIAFIGVLPFNEFLAQAGVRVRARSGTGSRAFARRDRY